ncbi:hypothetical protein [Mucilaginibacter gotjawali]|uniref:Uncharacterized protein n=1 Tax=Mucilaginibacter gotjawali TaxID=1550579 RepID=A0A839SKJ1_9SPHI|nr:hypothetical protein [Mucilaginibacter gotjawali]MBB3057813.1 hypothetical protein [Mucilaginibacter gotjawali]
MARKVIKKIVSKGERLGWTPLDQVQSVTLTSVIVKGKRVNPRRRVRASVQASQNQTSFLIP